MSSTTSFCAVVAFLLCSTIFESCTSGTSVDDELINALDGRWKCEYTMVAGMRQLPTTSNVMSISFPTIHFLSSDTVVDFGWYRLENDDVWRIPGRRVIKFYSNRGYTVRNGTQDSVLHELYYDVVFDHDTLILNGVEGYLRVKN